MKEEIEELQHGQFSGQVSVQVAHRALPSGADSTSLADGSDFAYLITTILIDSKGFSTVAISLGTLLFAIAVLWALWYAANMD